MCFLDSPRPFTPSLQYYAVCSCPCSHFSASASYFFLQIPEPYALLALIYQDGGKFEPALQFYKLACARDTRNWGNHHEAARIAERLGDHASRLEALRVLARLKPDNLNVAIERARCLVELQKPRQVGRGGVVVGMVWLGLPMLPYVCFVKVFSLSLVDFCFARSCAVGEGAYSPSW